VKAELGDSRPESTGLPGPPGSGRAGVLIVEDQPELLRALSINLRARQYDVLTARTGREALAVAAGRPPDAVILDLGLPDIDGTEVIVELRRWSKAPIIVLSGRSSPGDKIGALDVGADDYVTKPFAMAELLARLRAALRHQLQVHGERPVFRAGDLAVDLVRRIVKVGDKEVKLSPKEYDLLRVLVQHAGKVLTHRFLLKELWDELTDAQYLRVYVRQLRQKIEADPERPQFVLTETGIGYRLRAPD